MENSIIVYKNGEFIVVPNSNCWEYQNDPDWLVTIKISEIIK